MIFSEYTLKYSVTNQHTCKQPDEIIREEYGSSGAGRVCSTNAEAGDKNQAPSGAPGVSRRRR